MALTHPSPNHRKGRSGQRPFAIVVHIMEGSLKGTDSWFMSSYSGVSAHYGVGRNGTIHSYVDEKNTAFHAGIVNKPSWKNIPADIVNPNAVTIGIEHEGTSKSDWTKSMKEASASLIADICKRWNITPSRDTVIGHYEIDKIRRPNCPAVNKNIIDELVAMARIKMYGVS